MRESILSYSIQCFHCEQSFNGALAHWCHHDPSSSLICPNCRSCFCSAPIPYKRRVWSEAPRSIRENPLRFGYQVIALPVQMKGEERPAVLVVDDDEAMRSLVVCVVEHLGYRAIEAADPFEAFAYASGNYVDVIITDALMPKMDGRELCRRVKASSELAHIKVIIMTSLYKSLRFRNEAISQFGADDFLVKPLDFAALAKALERLAPLQAEEVQAQAV